VLSSLDGKLLCPASADALCLLDDPLLLYLVAVDALCLLDGSKLSCLVAADALCLLDNSVLGRRRRVVLARWLQSACSTAPLQAVVLGRRRTLCSLDGSKLSCKVAADALYSLNGNCKPFS